MKIYDLSIPLEDSLSEPLPVHVAHQAHADSAQQMAGFFASQKSRGDIVPAVRYNMPMLKLPYAIRDFNKLISDGFIWQESLAFGFNELLRCRQSG